MLLLRVYVVLVIAFYIFGWAMILRAVSTDPWMGDDWGQAEVIGFSAGILIPAPVFYAALAYVNQ